VTDPAASPAGVVVLGMHRSGTSAATRLVSLLGLQLPSEEDLVPPSAKNPKGYWESLSLVAFNERLLRVLGSDMRCPVRLEPGWELDERVAPLRSVAPSAFRQTFPGDPWVWKDPRLCLTLPFWTNVVGPRPAMVLVNRNPLEIVSSTARAGRGEQKVYVLALWERYLREALAHLAGRPALVTSYESLLTDPVDWCGGARDFLASAGFDVLDPDSEAVRAFVDGRLRHAESSRDALLADDALSPSQRELFLALERAELSHERFRPPELPDESPSTEALLAERRRVLQLEWELTRSRERAGARLWTLARRFWSGRARLDS
jgi:hypothetical protein